MEEFYGAVSAAHELHQKSLVVLPSRFWFEGVRTNCQLVWFSSHSSSIVLLLRFFTELHAVRTRHSFSIRKDLRDKLSQLFAEK